MLCYEAFTCLSKFKYEMKVTYLGSQTTFKVRSATIGRYHFWVVEKFLFMVQYYERKVVIVPLSTCYKSQNAFLFNL